jgi:hypothetical protein
MMFKGITDLAGIGKLVGELRGFVMELLRHRAERQQRELKNNEQALRNEAFRLKNQAATLQLVQRVFSASKKSGCSPEELLAFITDPTSPRQIAPAKSEINMSLYVTPKLLGE